MPAGLDKILNECPSYFTNCTPIRSHENEANAPCDIGKHRDLWRSAFELIDMKRFQK
jgi:hypothetical protein